LRPPVFFGLYPFWFSSSEVLGPDGPSRFVHRFFKMDYLCGFLAFFHPVESWEVWEKAVLLGILCVFIREFWKETA
jgi:hypothetical protein